MKLNIGAGFKRLPGFLNVDYDEHCSPDYVVDLEKDNLPFPDNSVDEIVAHHVLEHLGEGFFHFMQEMYRVCEDGAIIDVVVPHHRHEFFLNDTPHRRPITIEGIKQFSKVFNKLCIETNDGQSKLGILYDVDFEIAGWNYVFDPYFAPLLEDVTPEKEQEIQHIIRTCNNVIMETHMTLRVVK
jgi:ubiquinone/menaquinone biosynthesis C-methylase UbiE